MQTRCFLPRDSARARAPRYSCCRGIRTCGRCVASPTAEGQQEAQEDSATIRTFGSAIISTCFYVRCVRRMLPIRNDLLTPRAFVILQAVPYSCTNLKSRSPTFCWSDSSRTLPATLSAAIQAQLGGILTKDCRLRRRSANVGNRTTLVPEKPADEQGDDSCTAQQDYRRGGSTLCMRGEGDHTAGESYLCIPW